MADKKTIGSKRKPNSSVVSNLLSGKGSKYFKNNGTGEVDGEGIDLEDEIFENSGEVDGEDILEVEGDDVPEVSPETQSQSIKVKEVQRLDANGNVIGTTKEKNYIETPTKPKTYNYGKGEMSIEDVAKNLYGDKYADHTEGLARALVNKDRIQSGADYGKYRINGIHVTDTKKLGEYLYNNPGYSEDYINGLRGSIPGAIKDSILKEGARTEKDDIIQSSLKNADDDYYYDLRKELFDNEEVNGVLDKLRNGKELNADEVKIFQDAKDTASIVDMELRDIASKNGYNTDNFYTNTNGSSFRNLYGKNNATFKSVLDKKELFDYEIKNGRVLPIEQATPEKIDYIDNFKNQRDFVTAKEDFKGSAYKYLEDTEDAFYGSEDATKLLKLRNNQIGNIHKDKNINDILTGFAYAHKAGLEENSETVINLKNAAKQYAENYSIDTNNIKYTSGINPILVNNNGKFSFSQEAIARLNDEQKETYKKIIENKDIGQSKELNEVIDIIDRSYQEEDVLEKINLKKFNNLSEEQKLVSEPPSFEGRIKSFEDIKDGALKNYNKVIDVQSEAEKEYGVKLGNKNVFEDLGVRDKEVLKELETSEDFNKLSPKAVGALYEANNNITASKSTLNQAAGEMKDRALKIGEEKLTDEQFLKIFGFDKPSKRSLEFRFKETGNIGKFLEGITDDNLNLDNLKGNLEFSGNKSSGGLSLEDVVKYAITGKADTAVKDAKLKQVTEAIGKQIDDYAEKNKDKFDDDNMAKIKNVSNKFKNARDFTDAERSKLLDIVDTAGEYKEKMGGIKTKEATGVLNKAKGVWGSKGFKTGALVAGGIGVLGMIGKMAGDATEERERKRQEMNQLIAQQGMSIRGGY